MSLYFNFASGLRMPNETLMNAGGNYTTTLHIYSTGLLPYISVFSPQRFNR